MDMTQPQQDNRFQGFAFGFQVTQNGDAQPLPHAVSDGVGGDWVWISLDPMGAGARAWLENEAGLAPHVVHALLAEDTSPRFLVSDAGALLILRGLNPDPKARPTDLVSVRLWVENDRVITVQFRPLATVDHLREQYQGGNGPKSPAELVVALAHGMIERMRGFVQSQEAEVDSLEDESLTGNPARLRVRLNRVRHDIVPLRRYLAPQRDAFVGLMNVKLDWLNGWWQSHLREVAAETGRHIDALDAIRESANIVQDTLNARIAERTNSMLVVLSIGAAAFLPLNLFVGLLGANVKGIPGADNPYAFWGVAGILALIMVVEYAIYRKFARGRVWK